MATRCVRPDYFYLYAGSCAVWERLPWVSRTHTDYTCVDAWDQQAWDHPRLKKENNVVEKFPQNVMQMKSSENQA